MSEQDLPVPATLGRYQIAEELGRGAMGVVYLGVDPVLARPVAIKVLKELDTTSAAEVGQFHARFRHEAEAAGRLSHPEIVQIYDVGPNYMVMEFIEGTSLSGILHAGGSFTVRQICALVSRIADAIDYAHRNGIVHRDIKPGNVMVLPDGGVKVMDFGVARLDTSNLTAAGTVVGSVRYMAPEQMLGEKVDGRADVFSLAAVAYELLTAHPPFPGKTITEVVSLVVRGGHVPLCLANPALPAAAEPVFRKAFTTRLDERYARAMDFARDLGEALRGVADVSVKHGEQAATPTQVDGTAPGDTDADATLIAPASKVAPPAPSAGGSADATVIVRGAPPAIPGLPQVSPTARTLIMEAAPHHREGVLMIDSDPGGAQVWLDGAPVGTAPVVDLEVSFGRHVVRLEAPGREPFSSDVDVRPDRPLRALSVTLPLLREDQGAIRPGQHVPFGPDVTPPVRESGGLPAYPEGAREGGLEGAPVVELWIGEKGDVVDVAIVESAGAILDGALLQAVTGWRFRPATVRGVPVSVRMTVQHRFRL